MTKEQLPTYFHPGPTYADRTFMDSTQARINKVIELYKKGLAKPVIFNCKASYTGIKKEDGWEEMIRLDSDFDFVKHISKYLIEHGVKPSDIIALNDAQETLGEVFFTSRIIREKQFKKIRVITSAFHMDRCLAMYKLVYGNEIQIMPERVYSGMDDVKLKKRVEERELKTLELFKSHFGKIKPGDMKNIEKVMYTKHKLYSNLPENEKRRLFLNAKELIKI